MFVRWKRHQRYRDVYHTEPIDPSKDPSLYASGYRTQIVRESVPTFALRSAVLVESVWTPAGPRHRHLGYLASIREGLERDPEAASAFWESAAANLRKARVADGGRIAGADLAKVVAALERVVPRPDRWKPPWDKRWGWRKTREEIEEEARMEALMAIDDGQLRAFLEWEHRHGGRYAPDLPGRVAAFLAERAD
jgi:hypothetical protein